MAAYSTLRHDEAKRLGLRFSLEVRGIRPLDGGMRNSSFLVDAVQGRFVLAVLDSHDFHSAQKLGELMTTLAEAGLPTPAPLLDGAVLASIPNHQLGSVGALIAQIHSVAPPARLRTASRRLPADWPRRLLDCDDSAFMRRLAVSDRGAVFTGLPRGLTHGDLFADNLLLRDGTWHVIDWEYASVDAYVVDLGIAAVGLCRAGIRLDHRRLGELVEGYERRRQLRPAERSALPAAIRHGALVLAFESRQAAGW